jgi:hypothetical protein
LTYYLNCGICYQYASTSWRFDGGLLCKYGGVPHQDG